MTVSEWRNSEGSSFQTRGELWEMDRFWLCPLVRYADIKSRDRELESLSTA